MDGRGDSWPAPQHGGSSAWILLTSTEQGSISCPGPWLSLAVFLGSGQGVGAVCPGLGSGGSVKSMSSADSDLRGSHYHYHEL